MWVFVRPNLAAINAIKAWLLRHPHPSCVAAYTNDKQRKAALKELLKAAEGILEAGEQPPLGA